MKQPKPDKFVVMDGIPIYASQSVSIWELARRATTYDGALSGCVTPRFIVAGKHPEVAPSDKFLIVHAKNGVICVQEIRVKDNFDAVICCVEELHTPDLIENGVVRVVRHVVCRYSG
jgi:hypothetical protein